MALPAGKPEENKKPKNIFRVRILPINLPESRMDTHKHGVVGRAQNNIHSSVEVRTLFCVLCVVLCVKKSVLVGSLIPSPFVGVSFLRQKLS